MQDCESRRKGGGRYIICMCVHVTYIWPACIFCDNTLDLQYLSDCTFVYVALCYSHNIDNPWPHFRLAVYLHRQSHRFLLHKIFSAFGARDVRKDIVSNLRVAQSSCAKKDLWCFTNLMNKVSCMRINGFDKVAPRNWHPALPCGSENTDLVPFM